MYLVTIGHDVLVLPLLVGVGTVGHDHDIERCDCSLGNEGGGGHQGGQQ